jgi:acetyltransferase-like isoleucine patch superfamily enzyme
MRHNLVTLLLEKAYNAKSHARLFMFRRVMGMDIHPTAHIASRAKLDKTYPAGIHIGQRSHIGAGCVVLSHDFVRAIYAHTRIGKHCFIGIGSIIMPGVTIGDSVIIGAGSVVTKDIPPRSIAAGNPAKVLRTLEEDLSPYGQFSRSMLTARTQKDAA